eukprot:NODE_409_length_7945_cov_0.205710.p4 type:complete len:184 gc:universal NODE_409_length_7945_cov_0.205710:1157-606(-)
MAFKINDRHRRLLFLEICAYQLFLNRQPKLLQKSQIDHILDIFKLKMDIKQSLDTTNATDSTNTSIDPLQPLHDPWISYFKDPLIIHKFPYYFKYTIYDKIEHYLQYPIIIFGKKSCPFCDYSKLLLEQLDQDYKYVDFDEIEYGHSIRDYLIEIYQQKTVPNIFMNGKHIGGYTQLKQIYHE